MMDCLPPLRDWIAARMGIYFPDDKLDALAVRLEPCFQQHALSGEALLEALRAGDQNLHLAVAQAVSTNHTLFFREQKVLDVFEDKIIPALSTYRPNKIWSAACSTGEEVYTILMMLATSQPNRPLGELVRVLGTDISPRAVSEAQEGAYGGLRVKDIPPPYLSRFFEPLAGGRWRVRSALREVCTFRRLNLVSPDWPFQGQFDVVFCRNVLYYFEIADQLKVLRRIYDATAPGGWLLTSVTESVRLLDVPWVYVTGGVYRKEGGS